MDPSGFSKINSVVIGLNSRISEALASKVWVALEETMNRWVTSNPHPSHGLQGRFQAGAATQNAAGMGRHRLRASPKLL